MDCITKERILRRDCNLSKQRDQNNKHDVEDAVFIKEEYHVEPEKLSGKEWMVHTKANVNDANG